MYGYTIEPHSNDPLVDLADRAMVQFSAATVPGAWLVDIVPVLEYLPEWMPGAAFKKTARLWRRSLFDTVTMPYEFVKQQMAARKNDSSFVSKSIEQARTEGGLGPDEEHAIKWTALSLYLGGADTSVQTIHAFFLAMSMFPDVQRKAQEEIDRVVGSSRLPSSADRDKLSYINSIVNEAQRWHPIGPMGFPHVSDEEDHIAGYRIPKGALLLPAIWWFTRDPDVYHDAEMFKPERYLEPYNEPLPTDVTFGFGRRICPGRYLADASLYLTFAQSLAVFNIEKAFGEDGKVIEPKHSFRPGIMSPVAPFQMRVAPRTRQHEQLIEDVLKRFPWEESDKNQLGQLGQTL
jgi:cytochrome P450